MCEFDAVFAFVLIKMIEKRQNPVIIAKD
ncbi:hypothetical protein N402_00980 [Helicobacter pylori FD423]|nr:hypothetical protein N402_00980 [Helicobacter pylori FD423]